MSGTRIKASLSAVALVGSLNALADTNGDFGGSNAQPYGYIYFTFTGT